MDRPKGELFPEQPGLAHRLPKYEDDVAKDRPSSPVTPALETSNREDRESANGSIRSTRRRSRSRSTDRHRHRNRRDDYYQPRHRHDDRYGQRHSHHYNDSHGRSRNDDSYRPHRSSHKRRASDSTEESAPSRRRRDDSAPSSRPNSSDGPAGSDRPGSSHHHKRPRREWRRDDRREPPPRNKTPEPDDDKRDLRTVFVQQLAARLRTSELKEFFETRAGPVQEAQIVKDRQSKRSKGIGYVEFKSQDSIPNAVKLTGQKLLGIPIIVSVSDAEKNRQAKSTEGIVSGNNNGQPYHRLYVGNLQFGITEEDVSDLFENFGPLDFVQLQKDEQGRSKGFGFVQFSDAKDAATALENMNGQMLNNRPMRVGLGTTDRIGMMTGATAQQQNTESGSAFSGAGGRGGYANNKDEPKSGTGASALYDADVNGVSFNNVSRHDLMRKLARIDTPEEETAQQAKKPVIEKVDPTRCICLSNMWSAQTTTKKGWQAETEQDVRQECDDKYGIVRHVGIDPTSVNGEVYVMFDRVLGGENAYRGLNGRFFDGARINAKYVIEAVYKMMFPKAANL